MGIKQGLLLELNERTNIKCPEQTTRHSRSTSLQVQVALPGRMVRKNIYVFREEQRTRGMAFPVLHKTHSDRKTRCRRHQNYKKKGFPGIRPLLGFCCQAASPILWISPSEKEESSRPDRPQTPSLARSGVR